MKEIIDISTELQECLQKELDETTNLHEKLILKNSVDKLRKIHRKIREHNFAPKQKTPKNNRMKELDHDFSKLKAEIKALLRRETETI